MVDKPEVYDPEAVVAANLTEHLVVFPQGPEEGVLKEHLQGKDQTRIWSADHGFSQITG